MTGPFSKAIAVASPAETEAVASELALWVQPGMVILLEGDLGSGKSSLARAFIRAVAADASLEVPSPSFSLVQAYEGLRVPLLHADLYRLERSADAAELGLAEALTSHGLIVEWPERHPTLFDLPDVLRIKLTGRGERRDIAMTASGRWAKALARSGQIAGFVKSAGRDPASRRHFQGDASARRYELVEGSTGDEVLMDMPARADHAIVRHGKSYSALVHLADDIGAVLAINHYLADLGYSAPHIHACDAQRGLALLEKLDGEVHGTMMLQGRDMSAPMQSAVDVLADMAQRDWPRKVSAHGVTHFIADFDQEALAFETSLLTSWFWPQLFGTSAPESAVQDFDAVWRELFLRIAPKHPVWVLRDYHSPNLIWLPERHGLQRTGLVDTQDAVMGHPAYDLVSLLQDARVDVAEPVQDMLMQRYVALRQAQGAFDEAEFRQSYAILGAQRATRLLGTFTRLSKRDGKHQYLRHRPRVAQYLVRNLAHPALAPLRLWYEAALPQALELART